MQTIQNGFSLRCKRLSRLFLFWPCVPGIDSDVTAISSLYNCDNLRFVCTCCFTRVDIEASANLMDFWDSSTAFSHSTK